MDKEIKVYELELQEYHFKTRFKGKEESFILKEMEGPDRDNWMNHLSKRMIKDKDGTRTNTLKSYDGIQATLLSMCVYDESNKLVPQEVITKWPAKMQTDLFRRAQKMSGLGDESEEEAKND